MSFSCSIVYIACIRPLGLPGFRALPHHILRTGLMVARGPIVFPGGGAGIRFGRSPYDLAEGRSRSEISQGHPLVLVHGRP